MKLINRAIYKCARIGFFNFLSDKSFLKFIYRVRMEKKLDLDSPRTFNEKIQWLKLFDRKERYIQLVDKSAAKNKVSKILGSEYVVDLIGEWDSADDIDFSSLPDKCVLKCNHDQGSTQIFDRKLAPDIILLKQYFNKRLKRSAFDSTREWPYKKITPKIICEPFLCDDIVDYKFFCFNGEPQMINIGQKSIHNHVTYVTFLDMNWNKMPFQRSDFEPVSVLPKKPENLDEMIEIARKLAKGTDFVRIDLFCVNKRIYFSEFTLYPTSGFIHFSPEYGDIILGEKIKLSGI